MQTFYVTLRGHAIYIYLKKKGGGTKSPNPSENVFITRKLKFSYEYDDTMPQHTADLVIQFESMWLHYTTLTVLPNSFSTNIWPLRLTSTIKLPIPTTRIRLYTPPA